MQGLRYINHSILLIPGHAILFSTLSPISELYRALNSQYGGHSPRLTEGKLNVEQCIYSMLF